MPFDAPGFTNDWKQCSLKKKLNEAEPIAEFQGLKGLRKYCCNFDPESGDAKKGGQKQPFFLLSEEQAGDPGSSGKENGYFRNNADRRAILIDDTEWAVWWLRSPGFGDGLAANVFPDGDVIPFGSDVWSGGGGVRPAFWLNL